MNICLISVRQISTKIKPSLAIKKIKTVHLDVEHGFMTKFAFAIKY